MLAGVLAGIKPGDKVIDVCAAPGGKSMNAALLGGIVDARDVSPAKLEKIRENLDRTEITGVTVSLADGTVVDVTSEQERPMLSLPMCRARDLGLSEKRQISSIV